MKNILKMRPTLNYLQNKKSVLFTDTVEFNIRLLSMNWISSIIF